MKTRLIALASAGLTAILLGGCGGMIVSEKFTERLERIETPRKEGLISDEEYKALRKHILDELRAGREAASASHSNLEQIGQAFQFPG